MAGTRHPRRVPYAAMAALAALCLAGPAASAAQDAGAPPAPAPVREYTLEAATGRELSMAAVNGIAAFRAAQDAFTYGLRPALPESLVGIAGGVWSFAVTYMAMIWPHEFGHVLRAGEVGGEFRIHDIGLPIPHTTMHLPADVTLDERALSVTGGFEVNALSARHLRQEFLVNDVAFKDDLSLAFAHRLMYTVYTTLVIPQDPADPQVWLDEGGDPVNFILPVWDLYSGGQVFEQDGSVAPGLVDLYKEAALLGFAWNLLDPTFYQQLLANFGDVADTARPWWAVRTGAVAWTWSTLFNTSPLGYELYLNNHVRVRDRVFTLYARTARPFEGRGLGLLAPDLVQGDGWGAGARLEAWDQALFGTGWAASADAHLDLPAGFRLGAGVGWKDAGYLLGRPMADGITASIRVGYRVTR